MRLSQERQRTKYALLSAKQVLAAWIRLGNTKVKRICWIVDVRTKAYILIRKCCLL